MFKKVVKIIGWSSLGIFLIGTLAFTSNETNNVKCTDINIIFDGEQTISLDKSEIEKLVKKADQTLLEKKLTRINAEVIEQEIEKHSTIENAEVYKLVTKNDNNYKGILTVKIKHRTPVLRIISNSKSYFLDGSGEKIPISTKYSANVIVVTGQITEKIAKEDILPLVKYIEADDFLSAQIEHIYVKSEKDIIMTPLVGDHFIEFGTLDDYREKFRNLKAFYEKVLAQNNWNKYKKINLAYKNQIIGIKR